MDPLVVIYIILFVLTGVLFILGLQWRNDRVLKYCLASAVAGAGVIITWEAVGHNTDGEFEILYKKKPVVASHHDGFIVVDPDTERVIRVVDYKDVKAILDGAEVFLVTKHYPQIGRDVTRQELEISQPEQH